MKQRYGVIATKNLNYLDSNNIGLQRCRVCGKDSYERKWWAFYEKKFPKKYTGFFILPRKCVNLSEKYVGPWFSFIYTNCKWILSSTYRPETYLPKRPVDLGRKPHEVDKPKHFKQK